MNANNLQWNKVLTGESFALGNLHKKLITHLPFVGETGCYRCKVLFKPEENFRVGHKKHI